MSERKEESKPSPNEANSALPKDDLPKVPDTGGDAPSSREKASDKSADESADAEGNQGEAHQIPETENVSEEQAGRSEHLEDPVAEPAGEPIADSISPSEGSGSAPSAEVSPSEAPPAEAPPAEAPPTPEGRPTKPSSSRSRDLGLIPSLLLLILILGVGAYFRFIGVDWDTGQNLHPDERFLTMVASGVGLPQDFLGYMDTDTSPLNPRNRGFEMFVYGSWPISMAHYLASKFEATDYGNVYIVGRQLNALFDLFSIFLVFAVGWRLYDRRVGLIAAAFYAGTTMLIQQAHFFTVDTPGNTYFLIFLLFFVWFDPSSEIRRHESAEQLARLPRGDWSRCRLGIGLGQQDLALAHGPLPDADARDSGSAQGRGAYLGTLGEHGWHHRCGFLYGIAFRGAGYVCGPRMAERGRQSCTPFRSDFAVSGGSLVA